MIYINFIYLFALYILLIPGFLIKQHKKCHLLYSLLFVIIFFITYELVNMNLESMSGNTMDVDIESGNIKDLVGSIEKNSKLIDVDVQNTIVTTPAIDTTGITDVCEKKIKEIANFKQQISDLTGELDKFSGTEELVANLKNSVSTLQKKQNNLYKQLNNASETIENKNKSIDSMGDQISNLQGTITIKDTTINEKDGTIDEKVDDIKELNDEIDKQKDTISEKDGVISKNNTTISGKTSEINTLMRNLRILNEEMRGQTSELNKDNSDLSQTQQELNSKNNTINGLKNKLTGLKQQITTVTNQKNREIARIKAESRKPVYNTGNITVRPWWGNLTQAYYTMLQLYYWNRPNNLPPAQWIWSRPNASRSAPRETVTLCYEWNNRENLSSIYMGYNCDNAVTVIINGVRSVTQRNWADKNPGVTFRSRQGLRNGKNLFEFEVTNSGGPAGFILSAWKEEIWLSSRSTRTNESNQRLFLFQTQSDEIAGEKWYVKC